MKVEEFIEKYGKYDHKTTKMEDIAKVLNTKNYLPFSQKANIINKLCDVLIVKNEEGFVTYDTFARYLLFTMISLSVYTDLELNIDSLNNIDKNKIDLTELSDEYDTLMENGWIFPLLDKIGSDYNDFNSLLNMKWEERMTQFNSSEAIINRILGDILIAVQSSSAKVAEAMIGSGGSSLQQLMEEVQKQSR